MQAARSERKISPNNLDMKLLNFLHSRGLGNVWHSAARRVIVVDATLADRAAGKLRRAAAAGAASAEKCATRPAV